MGYLKKLRKAGGGLGGLVRRGIGGGLGSRIGRTLRPAVSKIGSKVASAMPVSRFGRKAIGAMPVSQVGKGIGRAWKKQGPGRGMLGSVAGRLRGKKF